MKPIPVNLAVEDLLSELVARRLLIASGRPYALGTVFNRGGNGYLKKTAPGWNNAAKSVPFFLLTDLDYVPCAPALLESWFPQGPHPNMIARVAVREVEAWLLADRDNFSSFLGVPIKRIPTSAEDVVDPKATLVSLASVSAKREIRHRLAPKAGSTAKQGPDYNSCLGEFVAAQWDPALASTRSESLNRCIEKLGHFTPTWA